MHPSITAERIEEGVRVSMFGDEMSGVCVKCGEDAYGVEPDAEGYRCESCSARAVYGWEQIGLLTFG